MDYKTPGVYVEEISKFPPSVAAVETAIPAFIGHTENTNFDGASLINVPTRIKSMADYRSIFGGAPNEAFTVAVTTSTNASGVVSYDRIEVSDPASGYGQYKMYWALQLFFANGGGPCYIVSVGDYTQSVVYAAGDPATRGLTLGIAALEKEDEPTILVVPEAHVSGSAGLVYGAILAQAEKLQDRVALIDATVGITDSDTVATDMTALRNLVPSNSFLKYGAAYYPDLRTIFSHSYAHEAVTVEIDGAPSVNLNTLETSDNVLYKLIETALAKKKVDLPPSSAMAGIYAMVDNTRGVWKAPANVSLSSVERTLKDIDDDDQAGMNVDPTAGKSVNAIRKFTGKGILVWGARTLAGNDNEWRYISVRRFFNMVEESVKKASGQFVFEPNDANTWTKVRAMISNFLLIQWRQGALAGAKPEQAFFVKVGLGETMSAQDILEGRMIVEIGMAAVRPAEFIILKFSHKMQEA
ncbi:MAG: phage tail sheath family protein [Bacteroidota bacterium]